MLNWWKKLKGFTDATNDADSERIQRVSKISKCLGDFSLLTGKKWKCHGVYALENSKVVFLPLAAIDRKIKVQFTLGND